MAHYAFLDSNNIVTEVIVGKNEGEGGIDWEQHYGEFRGQTCKRTSYNTFGGVHNNGGTPYRKNYAGIGYTYDTNRDAFISPKPFASSTLNETSCTWEAPISMPNDETTCEMVPPIPRPDVDQAKIDAGIFTYWCGADNSWKDTPARPVDDNHYTFDFIAWAWVAL